jgi:hypothetical protein
MIEEELRPIPSKGWVKMIRKVYKVDLWLIPTPWEFDLTCVSQRLIIFREEWGQLWRHDTRSARVARNEFPVYPQSRMKFPFRL